MRQQTIKWLLAGMAFAALSMLGAAAVCAATTSIYQQSSQSAVNPVAAQDIQGQISALQQQLDQAKKDKQALLQELRALSRAKPVPTGDKARDQKALDSWQAQMNSLQSRLDAKDAQIRALEAKLAKLGGQGKRPRGAR